jgi:hypothetical protein
MLNNIKLYSGLLLSALFIASVLSSCGDCPITEKPPVFLCEVREATITEFNPMLELRLIPPDSSVYVPVARYSIHTFEFPADQTSSGSLPNDERFNKSAQIAIATQPFSNGSPFTAALLDYAPVNPDIVGDILVDSVYIDANPANSKAYIRFYGHLARFPRDFASENSQDFCDYLGTYSDEDLNNIRIDASLYGQELPNASNVVYDLNSIFLAINDKGQFDKNVSVPVEDKQDLIDKVEGKAINVEVSPGQVYFYRARNGRQFAVDISDIRAGSFSPNKNRVTIMFNPLK